MNTVEVTGSGGVVRTDACERIRNVYGVCGHAWLTIGTGVDASTARKDMLYNGLYSRSVRVKVPLGRHESYRGDRTAVAGRSNSFHKVQDVEISADPREHMSHANVTPPPGTFANV